MGDASGQVKPVETVVRHLKLPPERIDLLPDEYVALDRTWIVMTNFIMPPPRKSMVNTITTLTQNESVRVAQAIESVLDCLDYYPKENAGP